jgi:hypothetical protein
MIDEIPLHMGLAKQFNIQLVCIPDLTLTAPIVQALPAEFCSEKTVFPVGFQERTLILATAFPQDVETQNAVGFQTGYKVRLVLAPQREIEWAIRHYHLGDPAACPPPRTRDVVNENEFKITDTAGNTVMKSIDQLRAEHEAKAAAKKAADAPIVSEEGEVPPFPPPAPAGGNDVTVEDLKSQVARLQGSLKKQRQLLRALTELMMHRGYFEKAELRTFMDKFQ